MYAAQQDQAIKSNDIMLKNMEAERQKKTIETARANSEKINVYVYYSWLYRC